MGWSPQTGKEWVNEKEQQLGRVQRGMARLWRPLPGRIILSADPTLESGWMLCNGAAISRDDYFLLFEKIGTTFGSGNGTTTFNLPTLANPAANIRYLIRVT